MKLIRYTLALAIFSVLSCIDKKDNPATTEKNEQAPNKFLGEWVKVGGDRSIKFTSQGSSVLFNDGAKNFNAELSGDNSMNVDASSMLLGIIVFKYIPRRTIQSQRWETHSAVNGRI